MKLTIHNFLFLPAIFLSSFLLFQIQPLLTKALLPLLGGVPAVWTTCMVFFQSALCLGYFYAYMVTSRLKPLSQYRLHSFLLILSLVILPISLPDSSPDSSTAPILTILSILSVAALTPYLMLSATNTLLGSWLTGTGSSTSPYRLYAASNFASLFALLSFPFLFEPMFDLGTQLALWSRLYSTFVIIFCFLAAFRCFSQSTGNRAETGIELGTLPWLWVMQSACGSVLLLGVTNLITTEIVPMPLLWVLPLAVYLITFILPFFSGEIYRRELYGRLLLLMLIIAAAGYFTTLDATKFTVGPVVLVSSSLFFLFISCMICHGELSRSKPGPAGLNRFYLFVSIGGAAGGIFAGVLAPHIFIHYSEFPLAILLCLFLRTVTIHNSHFSVSKKYSILLAALAAAIIFADRHVIGEIFASRNFFGTLAVKKFHTDDSQNETIGLAHGKTIHGLQFTSLSKAGEPIGYYGPRSGIGRILSDPAAKTPRRIGAIGLGVGSVAAYGRRGDYFRFYEINPTVIEIAQRYFSFLKDSAAEIELVLGDARLKLQQEEPQKFDVLLVDAFNGDSLPTHLLTREALELYMSHLAPDGRIVFHISNRYIDLRQPILRNLAYLSLQAAVYTQDDDPQRQWQSNKYIVASRSLSDAISIQEIDLTRRPWTDDYSTLLPYFYR